MGDLIQFPKGEPEGEAPQTGHCTNCGVECSWPTDDSPWPSSCPNGCTPFTVTNFASEPIVTVSITGSPWMWP